MSTAATPAGRLVRAFGRPDVMAPMYAPDVTWHLPRGLTAEPMVGKEAVCGFNQMVWTLTYEPDCEVEVLDEVGDEISSAVRITYRATALATGGRYQNEYTVFVRSDASGIREVHEALDSIAMYDFLQGEETGATFARYVAGLQQGD
jgi:ketosteroid isomerase-like protein